MKNNTSMMMPILASVGIGALAYYRMRKGNNMKSNANQLASTLSNTMGS
ncbi:hypothetical protein [Saliterribacillus persicus]|uniref:Uncharacterized protein n=1 Tax=Saliterribacillus persicus TaxID=930114 RepID=A0A368XV89_9BACI|nr:hypothetical protein [Saliterribacillus persicus]RCW71872.1 hypothetical protein DFR57_10555 [Saliterribacillus persicus]